jgi:predicted DNA-binding protein (MmcQ/YjbR family)
MNIEEFRTYCLSKYDATESLPFDNETLVFKIRGKIFAILSLDPLSAFANLKCDPEHAIELREMYSFITPGYHMNKTYWNSIQIDECENNPLIYQLIDHSYHEVIKKFPKKIREEIAKKVS